MKKYTWHTDDVCIVGIGCVLPDADTPEEFWENIANGTCSIRTIPEDRWNSELYFSTDKKEDDKTYSNVAGFVEKERIERFAKKLGLDQAAHNRLQVMALEAATQAVGCLRKDSLKKINGNAAVVLGCMEIDEALTMEKWYEQNKELLGQHSEAHGLQSKEMLGRIERHCNRNDMTEEAKVGSVLTTSVIDMLRRRFGLRGEGMLVDAACASSLVAVDTGMQMVRNREVGMAVVGGMESNLGPDTFVLFSKVGALSEGKCRPFDVRRDGLSQGEGAVMFVLQRMDDAVRDGNTVYGVLRAAGSSSDGRSTSLFSPSVNGQVLAYERAYEGLDRNEVDYVECHGTGTRRGDEVEVAALNKFFGGRVIPIGSVKALIGHTKGAAGAAGLLKCVMALRHRLIAPLPYIGQFIGADKNSVYVNKEPIDGEAIRKPLRFGVSSFGFGNINYHIVLDEYAEGDDVIERQRAESNDKIVVIGESAMEPDAVDGAKITSAYRIPKQSVPHIDSVQLQGLLAVSAAFASAGIDSDALNKDEVSVIAASCLGLRSATDLAERVRCFELRSALKDMGNDVIDCMMRYKDRFVGLSEDTGPGVLNNVIAGRICNEFDFKGPNYNIDCDFNSFPAAMGAAMRRLHERPGIVVVVYADEQLSASKSKVERGAVRCMMLSTLSYAKMHDYPIVKTIKQVQFYDQ